MVETRVLLRCFVIAATIVTIARAQIDYVSTFKPLESFVELRGDTFYVGINDHQGVNHEYPHRKATVKPFRIMLYPVTIAAFTKFKRDKVKHVTEAEEHHSSWVLKSLVKKLRPEVDKKRNINDDDSRNATAMDMVPAIQARWNRPYGRANEIEDPYKLPAVHVSYKDAFAYCAWKNMRLPSEIEWEYAARGGLSEKLYPWGDFWEISRANLWQGKFPEENQLRDGHYGLSPVDAYPPQNEYGMQDVLGNVWEWTSTVYWNLYDDEDNGARRVLKGGSFMDTRDGEGRLDKLRIRVSARVGKHTNYTAVNVGFRCVQSIDNQNKIKFNAKGFNIVKLRVPIVHGKKTDEQTTTTAAPLKSGEKKIVLQRRVIKSDF